MRARGVQTVEGDEFAELVKAARDGDKEAFAELVRKTYVDTYGLAYRVTGDEDDACDVVQEAYLRAFRSIRRFRGDAAFSTWMYRIVANCASTYVSRRGRNRHLQLQDDAAVPDTHPESDPETMADSAMERDRVSAAVQALPARLRAVVVLRDVYDLPHEAIAAELGISETAAKVRLHRARKKLRERLLPPREDEERARAV
jgi:RNA polymerase sigma-70 factor (ECF subfamily)